jgi:hypothetical protein
MIMSCPYEGASLSLLPAFSKARCIQLAGGWNYSSSLQQPIGVSTCFGNTAQFEKLTRKPPACSDPYLLRVTPVAAIVKMQPETCCEVGNENEKHLHSAVLPPSSTIAQSPVLIIISIPYFRFFFSFSPPLADLMKCQHSQHQCSLPLGGTKAARPATLGPGGNTCNQPTNY